MKVRGKDIKPKVDLVFSSRGKIVEKEVTMLGLKKKPDTPNVANAREWLKAAKF